jgi:hypothetical protein
MTIFDGILGHEIPKRFFLNFIKDRERMPHALLLTGPGGVGKFATSFTFAKAFNCTKDSTPGCDCLHCRQIAMGTFSDLLITSSLSEIKAEQMRQLTNEVVISPRVSTHRIVIIDDFERVNETAANILLKTLEEPPGHLRFILITSRPERLLATIRSRCIPVDFKTLSVSETVGSLREIFPSIKPELVDRAGATGRFGQAAREIHADIAGECMPNKKSGGDEPYTVLIKAFVDGLTEITPGDFAHYLKGPLQTLLGSVEGRWKLKQLLPKGLDIPGLKLYLSGKLDNFTPVNYLTDEKSQADKLREYEKGRLLSEDLTQELYSRIGSVAPDDTARLSRLMGHIDTVREISGNLAGYRNIELSFEKLLIGPGVSRDR